MGTQTQTKIIVTCDNPKCGNIIEWIQEDVARDETLVPEPFFRLLRLVRSYVEPNSGDKQELVFCSAHCLKKWLEACYKPATSPQEKTKKVLAEMEKSCGAGPIQAPEIDKSACKAEVVVPLPLPEEMNYPFPPAPLTPKQVGNDVKVQVDNALEEIDK
jgi:hypothetical protein